jgi:hypothetical protein
MRNIQKLAVAAALIALLGACVAGSADSRQAAEGGALSQVLLGFWHGFIGVFTLIGEIINAIAPNLLPWQVKFFESAGHSVFYDFGFYVGLAGGPPLAISGWSRRRRAL